jgi:hypothetical protein
MRAYSFVGVITAAIAYLVCRRMLLRSIRAEKPELFAASSAGVLVDTLMGPSSIFPLRTSLDHAALYVAPQSRIWLYVRFGRMCLAGVYLLSMLVVFGSFG